MKLPKVDPYDDPYVLPTEMHRRDKWHIRRGHQGYSLWFVNEMRGRLFGYYAAGMSDDCKAVADALNDASTLTAERDGLRAALKPFADNAEVWEPNESHFVLIYCRRGVKDKPDLKITVGDLLTAQRALDPPNSTSIGEQE